MTCAHQLKAKVKAKDVCLKICFTFIIIFLDGSTQLLPLFIYIFLKVVLRKQALAMFWEHF